MVFVEPDTFPHKGVYDTHQLLWNLEGNDTMPEQLTPDILVCDFKVAGDPQVAPDGSLIAYTLTTVDREKNKEQTQIWLCDAQGNNRRQLTHDGSRNSEPRWSPDGAALAFVSNRVEKSGLFVMPLTGGDAREITSHMQAISNIAWSSDGQNIAYITDFDPDNPDEDQPGEDDAPRIRVTSRLDYKFDGLGYRGDVRKQLFVVNVDNGERRKLTDDVQDYANPRWSPDSGTIAVQRSGQDSVGSRLALIDVGSQARQSWSIPRVARSIPMPGRRMARRSSTPARTVRPTMVISGSTMSNPGSGRNS